MRITEKHQEHLLRHGFVIVPNFLTSDELSSAREGMLKYFPTAEELAEKPQNLGPTFVVSQEKTHDLPVWPTHRPRKKNASLYSLERPILAQAGDLLIFSMRTWHRASDITADAGARFTHHFIWRAAVHVFQGF